MGRGGRPRLHDPVADEIASDIRNGGDASEILRRTAASVDISDGDSRTPLLHAVIHGRIELVQPLLDLGANIDHQDRVGYCAIHFAAQNRSIGIAGILLHFGATTEKRDSYGNTPLWTACFNARGDYTIVVALLSHGALLDNRNNVGKTVRDLALTLFPNDFERVVADAKLAAAARTSDRS